MIKRSLITGFAASSILLSAVCCYAGTFTAFGPKTFTRGSGSPVAETASFNIKNPTTTYTLKGYNGGINSEYSKVSSALISLSGTAIYGPSDFNQQVSTLQKQVNVSQSNQLQVELRSASGSGVTISIEGADNTPPAVAVSSPADNAYLNTPAITVTGTASDSISWVNAVTVNGTGAAISGESYSASLQLSEGPNAITATATDAAGNTGNSSITLILDTTPPKITLDSVKTITNNPQLILAGKIEDANPVSLTVNGAPVNISNNTFSATVNLTEGNNAITVTATDKAGNNSKTEITILLDTTPPTVTIASPVNQGTLNTSSLTVTGATKDASSGIGSVTVNGTNAEISGEAYSATIQLKEGENQITVTATDAAGNTGQSTITIYLDTTAPAISISSPDDGSTVNTETVTVTGTVDDNAATVAVNGVIATVSDNTFTVPNIALIEGINQITATGTDQVGNQSTATIKITRIIKDTTPPAIKILSPSEGYTSEYQEIEVLGTIDDDSATVTVNGTIAKVFKRGTDNYFTASGIKLMEGRNIITVTAVDGAGNTGAATVIVTYMTKNSAITIQYPFDGSIVNYPLLGIWGTVADNVTNVTVNGIPAKVFSNTFSATLTLIEGLNTITVSAYDMAGGMVTKSITVTYQYIDTTAPVISITSPSNGSTLANKTITVTGTVDDNTATVSVSGINASVSNNTFTASNISLTEGANTISATAADPAGNTSSSSITVYLDTVAPTVLSTTPLSNAADVSLDSNITVNFSEAIDSSTITTSNIILRSAAGNVSGYVNQSGNAVSFVPLNKLSYATTYTAAIKGSSGGIKDTAGNAMQQDYIWTFTTKDEPPIMIEITEPQSGGTINKEKTMIKGTIKSKATDVGITVNGIPAEINGGTWVALVPLTVGQNTIEAKATDSAGNTATQTITINTASTQQSVTITTNPNSGIAPLNAAFSIDTSISNTVTSYKIDFDGDGITDMETTITSGISHTYDTSGIYYPTVTVIDNQGNTYMETTAINVLSKDEMNTLLKGKWDGMKGALISGDIENALSYFVGGSKDRYREVFTGLGSKLSSIFSSITEVKLNKLYGKVAECGAIRTEAGGRYSYPVTFAKDENGIWKIMGF